MKHPHNALISGYRSVGQCDAGGSRLRQSDALCRGHAAADEEIQETRLEVSKSLLHVYFSLI